MLIGLHDADRDHMPRKTFPNFALMKISAYHKSKGDEVEWWVPFKTYDRVYSSKVFDFTPENLYLPSNTIKGGTGYGLFNNLYDVALHNDDWGRYPSPEVFTPDYSIYPKCDYALGFLSRGCTNECRWCIVPKKEGYLKEYRQWYEVVRNDTDKLVLLDNNILAHYDGENQLIHLASSKYKIDINQGMDCRMVSGNIADILCKIKWIRYIRFSCDTESQIEPMIKAAEKLKERGIKSSKIFIYLLVTTDISNAENRVYELTRYIPNVTIYAQPEINPSQGIMPNKAQKEFTRYSLLKGYRYYSFSKWCKYKE